MDGPARSKERGAVLDVLPAQGHAFCGRLMLPERWTANAAWPAREWRARPRHGSLAQARV